MRYRQQSAVIVAILTIALPRHVRWVLRTSDTFTILPPSLFLRFRTARSQTPRTHPRDCASHGSSLLASLLGSSVSSGTSSIIVYEVLCSCFVLSISRDIAYCVCLRCTVRPLTHHFSSLIISCRWVDCRPCLDTRRGAVPTSVSGVSLRASGFGRLLRSALGLYTSTTSAVHPPALLHDAVFRILLSIICPSFDFYSASSSRYPSLVARSLPLSLFLRHSPPPRTLSLSIVSSHAIHPPTHAQRPRFIYMDSRSSHRYPIPYT